MKQNVWKQMTWLDMYNFLSDNANNIHNLGNFPWQENVTVFDFGTLGYYQTDFIQMPDGKISLSIDSASDNMEVNSGS